MWNKRALSIGRVVQHPDTGAALRVVRFIAEGGYSEVYEVHGDSGERYALKCLQLKHTDNRKTIKRHLREGQTLILLRHPNVVHVHAVGFLDDDRVYILMDLLEGWTLRELQFACGGRIPVPWVLQIMISVCAGLAAIHERAVHRDLKPENIHVSRDGSRVRLFDLGVSRIDKANLVLTTPGVAMGTFEYMSPEQLAKPESVDGRSDLFAVGVIFHELVAGQHPFGVLGQLSDDRRETGAKIMLVPHPSLESVAPQVPRFLSQMNDKLLTKDAKHRYRSALETAGVMTAALARYTEIYGPNPISLISTLPRDSLPLSPRASVMSASANPFVSVLPPVTTVRSSATTVARERAPAGDAAARAVVPLAAATDPPDRQTFFQGADEGDGERQAMLPSHGNPLRDEAASRPAVISTPHAPTAPGSPLEPSHRSARGRPSAPGVLAAVGAAMLVLGVLGAMRISRIRADAAKSSATTASVDATAAPLASAAPSAAQIPRAAAQGGAMMHPPTPIEAP